MPAYTPPTLFAYENLDATLLTRLKDAPRRVADLRAKPVLGIKLQEHLDVPCGLGGLCTGTSETVKIDRTRDCRAPFRHAPTCNNGLTLVP